MAGWKGKAFVRVKESRGGPPSRDPLLGGSYDYIRTPGGGRVERAIVHERFRNGHRPQPRGLPPGLNNEQDGFRGPQNGNLAPAPAQHNQLPQQLGGQRPPPPERQAEDGNESESSSDGEPGGQAAEEPQAANPTNRRSIHGILRGNNNTQRSRQAAAASHSSQNQDPHDAQSVRSNASAPNHDEESVHGSQIAADASVRSDASNHTTLGRHGRRVGGGNAGPAPRAHFAPPGYWGAPGAGGGGGRGPLPHGQARFEEASQRGWRAASFFHADELRAWNADVRLPRGITRGRLAEMLLAEPPYYPGSRRRRRFP